ncbi:hypothetical protein BN59_02794 [Legionella massiliensis]|uniref:Glycoside-hydrolase family GH114 TIM-barrel domain-containing protein n=1 Tax=Legionella massiliensis TaxID=1034943 RepID=A0A078L305_9GAMM|nr:endo alpha-1,4 polygalactosaminidase [Legionella massiliensis]CDZ78484.1 hypothetical protein BN59_02794 [Legionella massiliensis]CEE14222.1 hypothetical protein BN1094_02794 [Legionella massiliensis]
MTNTTFPWFLAFLFLSISSSTQAEEPTLPAPEPCASCPYQITQDVTWNYVLKTSPEFSVKAAIYNIDAFENSEAKVAEIHNQTAKAICYIDAGTWEEWRPDAANFPEALKGKTNGWPGEKWLDIRQHSILEPIMQARVDLCKRKGFDAIEFDNVDGYDNKSGFPLTKTDQLNYNILLANMAHRAGLAVGLKNDLSQIEQLVPYFDFAINEQCFQYKECDRLVPFINANKAVLNVEYSLSPEKFCSKANSMHFNSIKKKTSLNEMPVTFCK